MNRYEITFARLNSESYAKPITTLVCEPDEVNAHTGAMLFSHGWGGNRFQHDEKVALTADRHNMVCVSVEYRMSGYDFNPVTGAGAYRPYDASFLQVADVLNGFREVLRHYPSVNRSRMFHYGGSQGGHIALLSAIYAPNTFAAVYAASPLTHISDTIMEWAGRDLSEAERAARNAQLHAERILCPVFLEHGTADERVDCNPHTRALESRLQELGKEVEARYHLGGLHSLEPVTTRLTTYTERIEPFLKSGRQIDEDDFAAKSLVLIPCADRTLMVDWSKATDDLELIRWG